MGLKGPTLVRFLVIKKVMLYALSYTFIVLFIMLDAFILCLCVVGIIGSILVKSSKKLL